jgi:hydrogenase maturation protease
VTGTPRSVVAIGLGNPLLGDDGVGLRVIEGLGELDHARPGTLPPGTRLVAAGSPSLDLLDAIDDAAGVLLIDAADRGRRPGSVLVTHGDAAMQRAGRGAAGELLLAARLTGHSPGALTIVEVQVGALDAGVGLSSPVAAAIPAAVGASCRELTRLATGRGPSSPSLAQVPASPVGG